MHIDQVTEYIPIDKLVIGGIYGCHARNFTVGVWTGEASKYIREKFGHRFWDRELHYDSDPNFGTAEPIWGVVEE